MQHLSTIKTIHNLQQDAQLLRRDCAAGCIS